MSLKVRLSVLLVVAMMLAMTLMLGAPAFAQGGCKNFGIGGVVDQVRTGVGGMGAYARFFGPLGDMSAVIHSSQERLCSGGSR